MRYRCAVLALLSAGSMLAQTGFTIVTASPLPSGTIGVPYSQTFAATGGTAPILWGLSGSLPPGLVLNPATGVLSGVATAAGNFTFTLQALDSQSTFTSKNFTITILNPPLAITTTTLFNGVVGTAYTHAFSASGGRPPYRWSIAGNAGGLAFDGATGTLTGTPQASGSFPIAVTVTDSDNARASRNFTLLIEVPRLLILTSSPLPSANVDSSYTQTFVASGGTSPYTWSVAGGSTGNLQLAPSGVLSGVPSVPGTLEFTVQLRDSSGQTALRSYVLTVRPRPLTFTTDVQLSGGTVASPLSFTIAATGGIPPYSWSATGLPEGLEIGQSTGIVSGIPKAPGLFLVAVRVTDQTQTSVVELFRLPISLPTPPEFTLSGLPATVNAADQVTVRLSMGSAFPIALSGQLVLTFTPDSGPGDSTIQFSSGGRTVDFQIPAESTAISVSSVELQTGTVAGTLRVSVRLLTGGIDITPNPAPASSARVERAAPAIRSARMSRSGSTLSVEVRGFSTAREVTQAVFRFRAGGGNSLRASEMTVSVENLFGPYFQDPASARSGSQFVFTQPFTVDGDANAVSAESVTLTNRVGSTTFTVQQ